MYYNQTMTHYWYPIHEFYCSECGVDLRHFRHLYGCSQYVSLTVYTPPYPDVIWYYVSDPPYPSYHSKPKLEKKKSDRDW